MVLEILLLLVEKVRRLSWMMYGTLEGDKDMRFREVVVDDLQLDSMKVRVQGEVRYLDNASGSSEALAMPRPMAITNVPQNSSPTAGASVGIAFGVGDAKRTHSPFTPASRPLSSWSTSMA